MVFVKNIIKNLFALLIVLTLIQASIAYGETREDFNKPDTIFWTVPAGVYEITVEAWGGGGAGGDTTSNPTTGGGGGGGYARGSFSVTPGEGYTITVGDGGSSGSGGGSSSIFSGITLVQGSGGSGVSTDSPFGGSGGGWFGFEVDQGYSGGDGGSAGGFDSGGGGGGGAGSEGAGADGSDESADGIGGAGGPGDGGDGGNGAYGASGGDGLTLGGGGGGSGRGGSGGEGARGEVRIHYTKELPNVQRGLTTISSTAVETVDIAPVNASKAFVRHTMRSSNNGPSVLSVMSQINSGGDSIDLSRYSTSSADTFVEWEVVEDEKMNVQRGIENFGTSASTANIAINSVNLSQAFVIVSSRTDSDSNTEFNRGLFTAELTSSTNLRLERAIDGVAADVSWQVVEWEGSTVQAGKTILTGTTETIALSENINPQNAFLVLNRMTDQTALQAYNVRGEILNETHVRIARTGTGGTAYVEFFVVENPRFYVQQGQEDISGSSPTSIELTNAVNKDETFHSMSWSSTGIGTFNSNAYLTTTIEDDTNITFQKGTSSQTQRVDYYVTHIRGVCEPPLFGEDWVVNGADNCVIDEEYNLYNNNFTCQEAGSITFDGVNFAANSISAINACNIIAQAGAQVRAQSYPNILLTDRSVSENTSGSASAGVKLNSDGSFEEITSSGNTIISDEWALPRLGGSEGGQFETRATAISGSAKGSFDTWLSLDSNREWFVDVEGSSVSATIEVEIRDAETEDILDTAEINLYACDTNSALC